MTWNNPHHSLEEKTLYAKPNLGQRLAEKPCPPQSWTRSWMNNYPCTTSLLVAEVVGQFHPLDECLLGLLSAHPTHTHYYSGAVVFRQCNAERLIHPQDINILAFSMMDALSPMWWCCSSQACFVKSDLSIFPLLIYNCLMLIGVTKALSWFLLYITREPVYNTVYT